MINHTQYLIFEHICLFVIFFSSPLELVPYFILDEDDETIVNSDKKKAASQKASVEVMPDTDSNSSSSTSSSVPEQDIHYLGDELGSTVRDNTDNTSSTTTNNKSSTTNTDADDDAVNTVQPIDMEERKIYIKSSSSAQCRYICTSSFLISLLLFPLIYVFSLYSRFTS
jgi:hypothetical protein